MTLSKSSANNEKMKKPKELAFRSATRLWSRGPSGRERRTKERAAAACLISGPSERGPKNTRIDALSDLPLSFIVDKSVLDMHYCVKNLPEFRALAADHHLSKFSDFWTPDYHHTMPLKEAYLPEHLISGGNSLLA